MHTELENEIIKLEEVEKVITDDLVRKTGKGGEYISEMRSINRDMWEELGPLAGLDSITTFLQHIRFLKQNLSETTRNSKEIKKLERQINSPYFSRIDFREDSWDAESFYIGIYGFRKGDAGEILIYDWRAPVSSMFYDYEPGRASYQCPAGSINGDLFLKRQYRIDNGKLILMFDSTIAIEDDILQDILAGNADNRMKIIVSTIQREQNRAIRCENKRVLSVQGPAGSGKTSIALHRAAYLLYRHRDSIKAENIKLYTPNGIFAKYISSVLPELGEDDIPSDTLTGLAEQVMGDAFELYGTYADMMEWQLASKNTSEAEGRFEALRFKSSIDFTFVLEKYALVYENSLIHFNDLRSGDAVFADREELTELFHKSYKHMPVAKRLSRMEMQVMKRIKEYEKLREGEKADDLAGSGDYADDGEIKVRSRLAVEEELEPVVKEIKCMMSIDIAALYVMLFENDSLWKQCGGALSLDARRVTAEALKKGTICYEDQGPILYLMSLLGMIDPDNEIKHVIIDEAQDYSAVVYKLFSKLYSRCGITLLGDLCQSINPASGINSLKYAGELLDTKDMEYIELDKSYRSTLEIMEFASRIMPSKVVPFGRHGNVPDILNAEAVDGVCGLVSACITEAKEAGFHSMAVICRTLDSCYEVYSRLSKTMQLELVANGGDEISAGIIVIPSYLAKGLEFDAVIVPILSEDDYISGEDQLLYTVCTRALHMLRLCVIKNSKILRSIC